MPLPPPMLASDLQTIAAVCDDGLMLRFLAALLALVLAPAAAPFLLGPWLGLAALVGSWTLIVVAMIGAADRGRSHRLGSPRSPLRPSG